MNDTLSLNKLEKIIELEATLREEYQQKLDKKDALISALTEDKATLERKVGELEQTVATQLKNHHRGFSQVAGQASPRATKPGTSQPL
ncbi:MAG: hypothetical protein CM15mP74_16660 [Halieaceae bacterium]|nr:MAG: hypothetical protein CM15mP74_16660 [Halieaceae bacterium]